MTTKVYIDDIFVCTIPIKQVDGMIRSLHAKGVYNVRVIEEQKP